MPDSDPDLSKSRRLEPARAHVARSSARDLGRFAPMSDAGAIYRSTGVEFDFAMRATDRDGGAAVTRNGVGRLIFAPGGLIRAAEVDTDR